MTRKIIALLSEFRKELTWESIKLSFGNETVYSLLAIKAIRCLLMIIKSIRLPYLLRYHILEL